MEPIRLDKPDLSGLTNGELRVLSKATGGTFQQVRAAFAEDGDSPLDVADILWGFGLIALRRAGMIPEGATEDEIEALADRVTFAGAEPADPTEAA